MGNPRVRQCPAPGCDGEVSHVDQSEQFAFQQGDRISMLLDLDAGCIRFYRSGKRPKQEFAPGVTAPLLRFVKVRQEGVVVTALPGARSRLRWRRQHRRPARVWARARIDRNAYGHVQLKFPRQRSSSSPSSSSGWCIVWGIVSKAQGDDHVRPR
jgi:hypothetical protein